MKAKSALIASIATVGIASVANGQTFNGGGGTIPNASAPAPSTPYPSIIAVAGLSGSIVDVNVTINGLTHTYPGDIDILLVGPGGQSVVLMSDTGYYQDIAGINLTFDDAAAGNLPFAGPLVSGTYKPTNLVGAGTESYPAPAPAGPYGSTMSVFNGLSGASMNGNWSLFIVDDFSGDPGSWTSWSITFTVPGPGSLALLGLAGIVGKRRRRA